MDIRERLESHADACRDALGEMEDEVQRLRAEVDQQRTRAEAAEAELRELRELRKEGGQ